MPRKQAAINDSSAAASAARATKPKTTRAKSAKHSKATSQESISTESVISESDSLIPEVEAALEAAVAESILASEPVMETEPVMVVEPVVVIEPIVVVEPVIIAVVEDGAMRASEPSADEAREEIARMAYGYWEARGRTGGDPLEDWVRAENEYRQRWAL